ncbi:MAG TPA: T9SS type A sorting domain-containing protein [Flavobacterium sp.]|uniref:T9SS type A sorting domain-containing protein n=1 Tax=Flavobacterium sp. TaxID=239 RepID=UPI002B84639F|nr:T9SS type A sorting domain-containing protein [Flavobacterium sp.]HSD14986.1 T9SS type A sorting domain-containing protein [Flavobacterium sp.]
MRTLLLKKRIWSNLILLSILLFTTLSFGQTVTLDQADLDYAPGETVYITGTGWQPNEVINLRIDHLTDPIPDHGTPDPHDPWTIVADNSGNFDASWFVTEYELGSDLLLVADGSESGFTYEVFFTDGNITITPSTVCAGALVTMTASGGGSGFTNFKFYKDDGDGTPDAGDSLLQDGSSNTFTINSSIVINTGVYYIIQSKTGNTQTSELDPLTVYAPSVGGTAITSTTLPICEGGNVQLSVNGATGTVVKWQRSANGTTFTDIGGSGGSPYTVNNISATTYYRAEVKSGVCTSDFSNNILVTVNTRPDITSNPSNQIVNVGNNASFNVSATGAGLNFQWQVNTGGGFSNLNIAPPYSVVNTATSSVLSITDATLAMNGYQYKCMVSGACPSAVTSGAASLTVNNPCVAPVLSIAQSNVSCNGANDGGIILTTNGGNPNPFSYLWSNGATTKDVSGLAPGNYTVTVTTASGGCSVTSEIITITAPSAISGSGAVTSDFNGAELSCADSTDGEITVTASGGTGALSYSIDGGSYGSNNVFSGLGAGLHTLSVKDANECTFAVESVTITAPSEVAASCSTTNNLLYYGYSGDQTATITVNPSGGVGPYKVSISMNRPLNCNVFTNAGDESWIPGANTNTSLNTAVSCPSSGSLSVNPVSTSNCTINASTGYSVTVSLMADATFTATVMDANGCTKTCTITVLAEDVRCFAGNSGNQKIAICHRTGSNKNPCTSICVDPSAVAEHLAHGDVLGKCPPSGCPTITGNKSDISFNVIAHPNPSNNQFTFEIESESTDEININVLDISGRLIKEMVNIKEPNVTFGENLPRGVYIAIVQQGSNQKTIRIVKE